MNINPEWVKYNNLHNEGGEGYNPYPKYIDGARKPDAAKAQAKKREADTRKQLDKLIGKSFGF